MKKRIAFIINPVAGQGAGAAAIPELNRMCAETSQACEFITTERPHHATVLAFEAATQNYEIVVAVGGDGTSNEVLNGLMKAWNQGHRSTKMGIIGIGRGNDFAYGFGIPPGVQPGFNVVLEGKSRPMDVGLITGGDYPEGRYFGNGVGIGFDAVVGFEAMKLTHLHGFTNYIVAALRTIFLFFNAPNVRIVCDNAEITQPSLMVSIMNGRRMGGGFMMAPAAMTDDGMLDICIAGQVSRLGILTMIPRFMRGTQASRPEIKTARAVKIRVTALDGVLPTHADGETICIAGKELLVEIIKQPLEILTGTTRA